MRHMRVPLVGVLGAIVVLVVLTACSSAGPAATSTSSTTSPSTTTATPVITQPISGSVTPSASVQVGSTWMITVHSAQAYPNGWNAPAGMPGGWGHMGRGYMAVVLDVSAQTSATPTPGGTSAAYAGPVCTLRGGWGMMGRSMMGNGYYGAYGWHMMSPGLYRGPMAYMAPTATHQFTLVCTDPTSGNQASWNIGF